MLKYKGITSDKQIQQLKTFSFEDCNNMRKCSFVTFTREKYVPVAILQVPALEQ